MSEKRKTPGNKKSDVTDDAEDDVALNQKKSNKDGDSDAPTLGDRHVGGKLESVYYSVVSHTTAGGRIIFGNNEIEIFPDKELPDFANLGTKAFLARDMDSNIEYVAILCGRSNLPRVSSIGSYRNLKTQNILKLVAAGVVNWAPEGRQRFALIFQKPTGKKILADLTSHPKPISSDVLVSMIIKPAINVLHDLENIDLVHGSIRLDNMYSLNSESSENFLLGECLSSAPSFFQHPIYEPAARAIAKPARRGPGTIKEDLYALGICVAMLVKGKNFTIDKTEEQIIAEKMQFGSYVAIIGKETIASNITEFLRGVLNDDAGERWDIEDCMKWVEGRRINPKPSTEMLLAQRPFEFKGKEYFSLRLLANAFASNIVESTSELSKSFFLQWLRRNFDDKDLKERFDRIYDKEQIAVSEKYMSMICSAIDPFGPVRYKDLYIFPTGFGVALSEAIKNEENLQFYTELVKEQILNNAVNQVAEHMFDSAGLNAMFEKCRSSLNQKSKGYGIERVLYIANPVIACMSPYFDHHYVLIPGGLLLALEDISNNSDRPEMILDRHMIAFISVREPKLIDPYLGYLNSADNGKRIIGVLRVLNGIQRRFTVGPVPGVSRWIVSLLHSAVDSFNDKDLKEGISKEISKLQNEGYLQELAALVDNVYVVQEDSRRFNNARIEYKNLMVEKARIEGYLSGKSTFGRATGRQVAMIVSSIVALITIALYSFIYFYDKS